MASPTQSTLMRGIPGGVGLRYCIIKFYKFFCELVLTSAKTPQAKKIAIIATPFNAIQRSIKQWTAM